MALPVTNSASHVLVKNTCCATTARSVLNLLDNSLKLGRFQTGSVWSDPADTGVKGFVVRTPILANFPLVLEVVKKLVAGIPGVQSVEPDVVIKPAVMVGQKIDVMKQEKVPEGMVRIQVRLHGDCKLCMADMSVAKQHLMYPLSCRRLVVTQTRTAPHQLLSSPFQAPYESLS